MKVKWLVTASVLAGWLALGVQPASANLVVEYKLDAGALTPLASTPVDSGPLSFSAVIGGVFDLVLGGASSNSPGSPAISKLLSSALSITNLTGATHTLELFITAQDFTSPTAPPTLLFNSHIGGSVTGTTPGNALSAMSCIDTTNSAHACPGTITVGPGTPPITTGSFDSDKFSTVASLSAPFSLGQDLLLTLGAHGEIGYQWNTTLAPTAPEPGTLALLGVALVGLARVRSRKSN